ncbi:ABC transporter permease [Lactobacillus sp. ESL0681]|uniref:ABC transporter permease n=1 Tax=Lactobacillus sp. ESL0681 TaxID=2983211 RepID=UPI0023F90D8F|nr:ABC transporter permease [Lactobacillus sp. ESL0681]WEV39695.1 ABC transporter permease [Lactobacillus sp. ESL0681]
MIFSIKQEFYKLKYQKITWFALVTLLALMVMTSYTIGYGEEKLLLMTCYDAPDWIMFILVIIASTLFSMEFQNNTILTLLYKASSKIKVYLSKYIIIFAYDIFLHVIAIMLTIILKIALIGSKISWLAIYQYQQPIWKNMFKTMLIDLLTTMLIISLVFLLSCLINKNAVVITLSLLTVFMGQGVSANLLNSNKLVNVLKWNPFNMINLTRQYYNFGMYYKTTQLINEQIIIGTILYLVLFFVLGYLIFRQKKF